MLLALIVALLMIDLLVVHKEAHKIETKEAAIESAVWISCGLAFSLVIWWWFGGAATGEYLSGYLIEKSLSIDNVFVWALIMGYFVVPQKYQHRVLFWGIFGALVMRAIFIFAGVALIERFDWVLYVFGGFLLYTAGKLVFTDNDHVDPGESKFLKLVDRFVPDHRRARRTEVVHGAQRAAAWRHRCSRCCCWSRRPTSSSPSTRVPAVLAVSHEQFIVFTSNAFAILGLRSLYFLLADMHARFAYLQEVWRSSSPSSA